MHVSAMVHANWVRGDRFLPPDSVRALAERVLTEAIGHSLADVWVASSAFHESREDCPVSVRAIGMPPSGNFSDGFAMADKAEAAIKSIDPSDKDWIEYPLG